MAWYVYMLRLRNGLIYVGSTNDLNRRFSEHSRGSGSRACLKSEPVEMIYSEPFPNPALAAEREKQLKRWSRAKKLDNQGALSRSTMLAFTAFQHSGETPSVHTTTRTRPLR